MKGDTRLIQYLNHALKNELTAINQYFLHSRMYRNWGYTKLAQKEYEESIDEMKHADRLIERILFLEGLPNLQQIGKILIGENPQEMLSCDLTLETNEAIPLLREAVSYADSIQDYVSKDLFFSILTSEEAHVDWLETQLGLIKHLGISAYLQTQV